MSDSTKYDYTDAATHKTHLPRFFEGIRMSATLAPHEYIEPEAGVADPSRARRLANVRNGERFGRALDALIAIAGLVFVAPLMLVVVMLIASSGGPILFRHERIGRHGKLFGCLKFRTMRVDSDRLLADLLSSDSAARMEWALDHKLRRDPRITAIGGFLRKTSLDELPQLFNVIGGSMSIVGPRPIVPGEAVRYGRHIRSYCRVRPGITGLWQISGRNTTSYRRRVACDVRYVRTKSLVNDLKIMFGTIPAVCVARGAY